ncbi:MAG: ferritin [Amoebophilaceae bacterium]|jgi:ferritin|nr:ferritin [Amoebophilaceae bacterium]
MENVDRSKCSLSQETAQLLNQQVGAEGRSSAYYLAMASWCDTQGYKNAAKFLYHHAEEERAHMLKLFHYINDAGGRAIHPEITEVKHDFDSFRQVFELTLVQETKVTQSVHRLVDHCLAVKDFSTFNFLQWFVAEQIEEEVVTRRAVELFDVIGEEGIGRYTIDKAIGALNGGS